MKTLVTGSSGFIGRALVAHLIASGHSVTPLVRSARHPGKRAARPARRRENVFWRGVSFSVVRGQFLLAFDSVARLPPATAQHGDPPNGPGVKA